MQGTVGVRAVERVVDMNNARGVPLEISGRMHIAQGVMKAINVNRLTKAGVTFKFWVGRLGSY